MKRNVKKIAMKLITHLAVYCVCWLHVSVAYAQVIEGFFDGEVSSETIYLQYYQDIESLYGMVVREDSAKIEQGCFKFELELDSDEPRFGMLVQKVWNPDKKRHTTVSSRELILAKDSISIYTNASLEDMRVFHSRVNYDYALFKEWVGQVDEAYFNMRDEYIRKDMESVPEKVRSTAEFQRFSRLRTAALSRERKRVYREFAEAYPDSWISLHALFTIARFSITDAVDLRPLYEALAPTVRLSKKGDELGTFLSQRQRLSIGMEAPAFSLPDTSGRMISLTDFRGKYVLVEMTASWCGACRREAPHLKNAFVEFHNKGFDILSVSFDDNKRGDGRERWMRAIREDGTEAFKHVSDLKGSKESPIATLYHVTFIPQNFLIDPDGKIVAVNLVGPELRDELLRRM